MATTYNELGIDPGEVERALDAGMTFPAAWYSDPAIHRVDLERIFRRSWQVVCAAARVAAPGDHAVGRVGDVPVIIVRGEDGVLRGFINVCRHRAFPLASCDGHRKTLQCRYHAWTYDLDGSLRVAPRSEHEVGFDRASYGLLPIAVEVLGGFVWAHGDPDAPSLASEHPLLHGLVEEWGLDGGAYTVQRERHYFDVAANWKIFVENSSECYHCPTVHKASFGDAYDVSVEEYTYVNTDRLLGQLTWPNRGAKTYTGNPGRYRYLYVWPGTFLNFDDVLASWMTVCPTGPESCRVEFDTWANAEAPAETVAAWEAMYLQTNEEDIEVVALQQHNLTSRAVPYGRLMPNAESAIAHFHRLVWNELRRVVAE
jgi:phenylpropionate dioxygenase-like ring-hydroxylating dioxygenase large terminal subunit